MCTNPVEAKHLLEHLKKDIQDLKREAITGPSNRCILWLFP